MPSACSKQIVDCDMSSLTTSDGPLHAFVQILEKRVRNLEKRKLKLDGYRADSESGKCLEDDQKAAVAKYDEVVHSLEFAHDLTRQLKLQVGEDQKLRKKQQKKDQIKRSKEDHSKMTATLIYLDTLHRIVNYSSESSLLSAIQSKTELSQPQIDDVTKFALTIHKSDTTTSVDFDATMQLKSDHLLDLYDGKNKKLSDNLTYFQLKETLDTIISSNSLFVIEKPLEIPTAAFETNHEAQVASASEDVNGSSITSAVTTLASCNLNADEGNDPLVDSSVHQRCYQEVPLKQEPAPAANHGSFNFLQESQIDMESPHMDPAVVMVHPPLNHTTVSGDVENSLGYPSQSFVGAFVPTTGVSNGSFPMDAPQAPVFDKIHSQVPSSHQYGSSRERGTERTFYSSNHKKQMTEQSPSSTQVYEEQPVIGDWSNEVQSANGGCSSDDIRNSGLSRGGGNRGGRFRGRGRNNGGMRGNRGGGFRGGRGQDRRGSEGFHDGGGYHSGSNRGGGYRSSRGGRPGSGCTVSQNETGQRA